MSKPHIVAVAGGSCSGKTTMVNTLHRLLGEKYCSVLFQDSYYLGLSHITNYDHPDAIDFELMRDHLALLKEGSAIEMPTYDFATHTRKKETVQLDAKPIILVDGILILASPYLKDSFDIKVFVECDEEARRSRRTSRDVAERGRTHEDTLHQFNSQVVPAHNMFVEPSKIHADYICKQPKNNQYPDDFTQMLLSHCQTFIDI